ncbi:cytochrome P450 4c3-like [Onthophagus taurus]|uniref:cytochrome P450 4c3-like n=1 Tax=Onthophagus taurus TaxID=166361 RepID=UPI000C202081|nr:cytochrome P450 4c3-like [Onthophagus taurus]
MFILILFITTVLFFTWCYVEKRKYKCIEEKIPGPPANWLTGNAADLGNNIFDLYHNCQRLIKTYGKVVRIWQGPFRVNVFITDPKLVEYFLSSQVHIKKSLGYDIFKSWLGEGGLINSSGKLWSKYRKILTPAFHFSVLDQFSANFHNNTQILIQELKKQSGKVIDIFPFMKLYALDSLCESSMAVNFRSQESGNSVFAACVDATLDAFIRRFFSILNRYDFLYKFTSESKQYYSQIDTMHNITTDVIQKRRENLQTDVHGDQDDFGIRKRRAFIDVLLERGDLSDQEIEWQVNTFMFAGQDTVGTALSFSLYELAKHKDVCDKIRNEIIDVVGQDRNAIITAAVAKELHYLDRAYKECLRLFPPVSFFERELLEDVKIDDLVFPKGTTISFHPHEQHRDPELFPDPDVFNPDRFLPENCAARHRFAYIPFSAGPRNCIGQKYAIMNCKVVLANIIRNFDLSPPDEPHTVIVGAGVIKAKNGLPIKLTYRQN